MRRIPAAPLLLLAAACAGAPRAVPTPSAPPAQRTLATTRGKIFADDGGTGGLPVIFLHGAGGDASIWAAPLARARKARRAVALDLPGFGRSDPPRGGDLSPAALGEDVGRAADALGITRFVLVAHDFAGTVAVAYAARHPLRVAGILFVDAYGGRLDRTPAVRAAEAQGFEPDHVRETIALRYGPLLGGALDATRESVLARLEKTPPASLAGAALAVLSVDGAAELGRYKGPRFALAASQFVLLGIQANVEGLPYRKVEGTSHWIMLDQPGEVSAALDDLLKQAK